MSLPLHALIMPKRMVMGRYQTLFFNDTFRSMEYHRGTSKTTRSYPSPLGNNAYTPIQEKT
ncbi:hypothetical protein HanPI659440_Chr17g0703531 [Helianthus annuus]|nr:hypothetical protein HanPI659440_Chr17g0703531 [Helianthus annuus]